MKFGENLQSHITHEWRTQYIDYERLKNVLYEYKEEAPAEGKTGLLGFLIA